MLLHILTRFKKNPPFSTFRKGGAKEKGYFATLFLKVKRVDSFNCFQSIGGVIGEPWFP